MASGASGEMDLTRLTELERLLGAGRREIIATLLSELARATEQIESGVVGGDLPAAALAAHAARNSALMLDAQPLLDALREIETAARRGDSEQARSGLGNVHRTWPPLRARLEAEAGRADTGI